MKRFIGILVIMILLTVTAAHADQHLEITFSLAGELQGRTESVDLYEQEEKLTVVSSLFPDQSLELDPEKHLNISDFGMLISVDPAAFDEFIDTADHIVMSWIDSRLSEPVYDRYAGELFDNAQMVQTGRGMLSELAAYSRATASEYTREGKKPLIEEMISFVAERLICFAGDSDAELKVSSYDGGKYLSVNILIKGITVMTVSADRSGNDLIRLLIAYRENGKAFLRDITLETDGNKSAVRTSLISGNTLSASSGKSSQLFAEELVLDSRPDQSVGFSWIFSSDSLRQPLVVSGSYSGRDGEECGMDAGIKIEGTDDDIMQVSIRLRSLQSAVSFPGKKAYTEAESTGVELTVMTNVSLLAAEFMPSLPADYQRLIMNLLYP